MDLFQVFQEKRGIIGAPLPVFAPRPPVDPATVAELFEIAFSGRLRDSYLVPVLDKYQAIFGTHIILCPDEDEAQRRQKEKDILAFAPDELLTLIRLVLTDVQKAVGIMAAKKAFCGIVSR